MIYAAKVRQPKGTYLLVNRGISGENWQVKRWLSGFYVCPDNTRCFNVRVWEVVDTCEFFYVQNVALVNKEASAIFCNLFRVEARV